MDSIGIWLLVFKQPILMRHGSPPDANLSKKLIPILMYKKYHNTDTQEKKLTSTGQEIYSFSITYFGRRWDITYLYPRI